MTHPKACLCNVCLIEKLFRKYFNKKMLCDIYAENVVMVYLISTDFSHWISHNQQNSSGNFHAVLILQFGFPIYYLLCLLDNSKVVAHVFLKKKQIHKKGQFPT